MHQLRKLPVRYGCPLALAISATAVALVAVGVWHVSGGPFRWRGWDYYLIELAVIGLPFAVLASARTRDWTAWLMGIVLTVGVWSWYLHELSKHEGVNVLLGLIQLVLAPLAISGLCLATAGMRGGIPDWGAEDEESAGPSAGDSRP